MGVMTTERRFSPVPVVVAAGVAAGGLALVAGALRWEVAGASGVLDAAPGWAALPPGAWLAVVVAGALVRAGAPSTDASALARVEALRRFVGPLRALATALTVVVAGVATARLVRVALDDTTVARITPTVAAWVAPVASGLAGLAAGWSLAGWRRWLPVAGLVVAVVVGMVVGAWPPGTPVGVLTTGSGPVPREAFRPAHRPPAFGVTHLAAVGDALYGEFQGELQAVDERGRWFGLGPLDDLRPALYVGRATNDRYDTIGEFDVVGLAPHGDELVVATRLGGLFTAFGARPGRMLAAVPTDRSPETLAALDAAGVPRLPAGAAVEGVGPDGRGGLLVATTVGLFRLAPTGALDPVPGAEALLAVPAGGPAPDAFVHGRADGSIVLALPCTVHELPAGGGSTRREGPLGGGAVHGRGPFARGRAARRVPRAGHARPAHGHRRRRGRHRGAGRRGRRGRRAGPVGGGLPPERHARPVRRAPGVRRLPRPCATACRGGLARRRRPR